MLKKNDNIDEFSTSLINFKRRKKRKYREVHKALKQNENSEEMNSISNKNLKINSNLYLIYINKNLKFKNHIFIYEKYNFINQNYTFNKINYLLN